MHSLGRISLLLGEARWLKKIFKFFSKCLGRPSSRCRSILARRVDTARGRCRVARARARSANNRQLHCIGSRCGGCGRQAARTAVRSEKTRCVDFHRRARKETLKRHSIGSIGNGCGRPAPRARRPCQSTGDTGYDPIQTGPSRRGGNLPVAERLAAAAAPFQGRCRRLSDRSTSEKEAPSRREPASGDGG